MLGIYCWTSKERNFESSTISQQRTAGVNFAVEHNFEYELYEDEGKSGFKISDGDQDPFNNRPAFTNLINDIKNKKIDKVWIWEHSRLSRNQYASAFIFNVFERYNVVLYENKKMFDMNDPQLKFTRHILDAVSEYERQLIVGRTTRGLHKAINEGRRTYKKLYGYERVSKDKNGHCVFELIESEINNYKFAFQRYMAGATLMKICYEIYDMNKVEKRQLPNYAFNLGKLLRLYQYTGYQLTIEGSNIYKRFRRNEIDNLKVLLDRKYWVKSIPYHYEIISIEDWVRICERLQIRGRKVDTTRKERILRASKDIATGLIECGNCGKRYYYHEQKAKRNKDGDVSVYLSYFHISTINGRICNQRPRSFKLDDINEIFKLFYFYFYMVFDNTNDLIKESQRNIKHIQLKLYDFYSEIVKDAGFIDTLWNNDDFIEVQGDTISRGGSKYTNYNDSMKQLFMRIYFRDRSKSERWNYGRYKIERIKRINKEGVESAEYFRKTIESGEDLNFKVWNILCNSVDRVCGVSIGNLIWWYCFMIETEVKIELLGRGKVVYNVFDSFYYDVNDKDIKDEIRELLNEKTVIVYDKYMKCIRL